MYFIYFYCRVLDGKACTHFKYPLDDTLLRFTPHYKPSTSYLQQIVAVHCFRLQSTWSKQYTLSLSGAGLGHGIHQVLSSIRLHRWAWRAFCAAEPPRLDILESIVALQYCSSECRDEPAYCPTHAQYPIGSYQNGSGNCCVDVAGTHPPRIGCTTYALEFVPFHRKIEASEQIPTCGIIYINICRGTSRVFIMQWNWAI